MFIVVPFIKSTAVAIVAEAKLRFGVFFFRKKNCRHSTDSFPFVWPSQLDIHKFFTNLNDSAAFLGWLLQFQLAYGTWKCLVFYFRFFGIMSSYVFICDAFFSLQLFPF